MKADSEQQPAYYESRKKRYLRIFDFASKRLKRITAARYDSNFADAVLAKTRMEFEELLPETPFIGKSNVFGSIMPINTGIIALYRAMKSQGRSAEETIQLCVEFSDQMIRVLPAFVRNILGHLVFRNPVKRYFAGQAARSQERRFPEDFVFRLEEGASGEMSLVFDECAVNKFYEAQGATELKPYCNFFDVTYSRLLGMGLDASETIGQGCAKCALRYQSGRATKVPAQLDNMFER